MNKEKRVKTVNGFKSIYPEECIRWRHVQNIVEKTVESFGFQPISPPSVEKRALYAVKPPWSEGLISETFSFFDNQQNHLVLIPEQTPSRARMVQELKKIDLPIRWFDTSKRWRQEKKIKKDRAREFWQTDVDIIGCDSVEADAEILACAAAIYENLGLNKKVEISINDRKLLEHILFCGSVKPKDCYVAVKIVDDKEKISKEEFYERFKKIGLTRKQISFIYRMVSLNGPIINCIKKIKKSDKKLAQKANKILKRFIRLSDYLRWYGIYDMCKIDLSIARGSFYTGIIFEVSDKDKELGALSGGGRYDWLVSMYGKRNLPAIGFGFGYFGTITKLKTSNLLNFTPDKLNVFIYCEEPKNDYEAAIKIANILRRDGYIAEINIGKMPRNRKRFQAYVTLKKNFYKDYLIEINTKKKKRIIKLESFNSLPNQL